MSPPSTELVCSRLEKSSVKLSLFLSDKLRYKEEVSVFLSVCGSHILRVVDPILFKIAEFVDDDSGKCSSKFGGIWTNNTLNIKTTHHQGCKTDTEAKQQAHFEAALHKTFWNLQ